MDRVNLSSDVNIPKYYQQKSYAKRVQVKVSRVFERNNEKDKFCY